MSDCFFFLSTFYDGYFEISQVEWPNTHGGQPYYTLSLSLKN